MHKIEYYNKKFQNQKEQGTDDWLEGRKYSFGGSELATVLGKNKYDTFENMIERKKNKNVDRCDTTEWGHLFELVAKKITNEKYGYIFNFSSIAHPFYPIAYSPDGILLTEDKSDIILLEIKNPIYRGVDKIPDHYMAQVQMGMNVFNVKNCIFAQFRFRRCKYGTFPGSSFYDWGYHKEWKRKCKNKPIAFGYLYWNADCDLIDLGTVTNITDHVKKIDKHEIIINEVRKFEKGKVLMWKLFESSFTEIEPDREYLKKIEKELWDKYKILYEKITT